MWAPDLPMSHRRHSSRPTALKPNRKGGNGEISASMFVGGNVQIASFESG